MDGVVSVLLCGCLFSSGMAGESMLFIVYAWQVEGMIYWFRRLGSVRDVGPWDKSSEEVSRYKTSPREKDRSLRISAGTKHHTEEIKSGVIGNYRR